jgi:prepilin-type N-terminal cleavage/methylation domain-containing protein
MYWNFQVARKLTTTKAEYNSLAGRRNFSYLMCWEIKWTIYYATALRNFALINNNPTDMNAHIAPRPDAFTLVELIVVISILAILATIAIAAFSGYGTSSRNSVKAADLSNMRKVLELNRIERWSFAQPDNGTAITYSGAIAWTQGTFGDGVMRNLNRFSPKPVDPQTRIEYAYSVAGHGSAYELWAVYEAGLFWLAPIEQVNAASLLAGIAHVEGNYNGIYLTASTGGVDYVLAVPTLIASDLTDPDLASIAQEWKFVVDGRGILPPQFSVAYTSSTGALLIPSQLLAYVGTLRSLKANMNKMIKAASVLQASYSGTLLTRNVNYAELFSVPISTSTPSEAAQVYASALFGGREGLSFNSAANGPIPWHWAWGQNTGWINMAPSNGDLVISATGITGHAWSDSRWWIKFNTPTSSVTNSCAGNVAGRAWASGFGWVDFSQVAIDGNGFMQGRAIDAESGIIVFRWAGFQTQTAFRPSCAGSPAISITSPANGAVIADTTPEITGTGGTPASTVVVTGPNGETCSALVASDGSFNCSFTTNLTADPQTLSATEVSTSGQAGDSLTWQVSVQSQ